MTQNTPEKDEKRVLVSYEIYATFASVRDTLKSRGVVDFTFSLFINHLLKKVPDLQFRRSSKKILQRSSKSKWP